MARQLMKLTMDHKIMTMSVMVCLLGWVVMTEAITWESIPAPDIPKQCNNFERCCMPTPYTGTPGIRQFEFDEIKSQPWRIRRPAHLLSQTEIARLEKGYRLMRDLPDSDPRSLLNQKNLHCLYCDNALYYPGQKYPLAIHNGWYFLPWHRMFIYWHERILAKLLDDDTFALSFWAWDNQQETDPPASVVPPQYLNPNSSLFDPNRNNCSLANPYIDLDTRGGICTNKTASFMRTQNNRLLYSQLVTGAPTPDLLYGRPYYFGDWGGAGPGTFEDQPHGAVHAWVGDPYVASPPFKYLDDMGNFGRAAFDPIFYGHHTNIDRVWNVWRRIPGGVRSFPMSQAFNNSEFTFYDENANLVKMKVSQVLDSNLLRYRYEHLPTEWVTNGVESGQENSISRCNPLFQSQVPSMIRETPEFSSTVVLNHTTPLTFKVKRPARSWNGTEVLELSGIGIPNNTLQTHWKAFLFFPDVKPSNNAWCPEYIGTYDILPVDGQPADIPKRVWRCAIGPKLKLLGLDYVESIVVTLMQTAKPGQNHTIHKARIFYDLSPQLTL